ncbi:MAG: hypothetical protein DI586_10885 [Micavibrio aeruginosavorus]|uniref:Uncharacterized protein n=1 Tax=Micavibrio aeruginosavorus TaxID=349221 RepID=A0A2W5HDG8_9BACT|nr:MAG: hypothetical protein DI586_10885 [Micavibrio aeruginosavorus]
MRLPATKPYVLIDLCDEEDPTRGDCNAYRNLGRLFAEKTGKEWVCVEDNDRCRTILGQRGLPDTVFSFKNRPEYNDTYHVYEFNENLSYYANSNVEEELVSHHVTARLLEEERHKFKERYPDNGNRLIALMNIEYDKPSQEKTAEKLADMIAASDNPKTTIFVCGIWRTERLAQIDMLHHLKSSIEARNMTQDVEILSYSMSRDFNERASQYNPYLGLIASADHFVILGHSMSIVSECLMSGKTLMLINNHNHDRLIDQGLCDRLTAINPSNGFPTRSIEPVNITSAVVDGLIRHYRMHEAAKAPQPS